MLCKSSNSTNLILCPNHSYIIRCTFFSVKKCLGSVFLEDILEIHFFSTYAVTHKK